MAIESVEAPPLASSETVAETVADIVEAVTESAEAAVETANAKLEIAEEIIEAQNDAALERIENEQEEEQDERISECLSRLGNVEGHVSSLSLTMQGMQTTLAELSGVVTGNLASLTSSTPPPSAPQTNVELTEPETMPAPEPEPANAEPTKSVVRKRRWI